MMKSTSAYFQVSGILVTGILLLPAIPALIAVITGKGQEEAEEPEPIPVPTPEPRAEEVFPDALEPSPESTPVVENNPSDYELDGRKWTLVTVFGVLGIALTWGFQVDRFASSLSVSVSRDEAVASATTFCAEMGLDVSEYSQSVQFQNRSGSSHFTHLVRKAGVARAESLAIEETKPWRWQVRWFKGLQKEEIRVSVGAAGGIVGYTHMIPEGQEGDELEVGKARALAEEVITNHLKREVTDSSQYKVLEERSEKEEARMDHHFVWEQIDRKVEDGEFRITSRVQGSEVGAFGLHYKAPEKFLRDLRKQGPKEAAAGLLPFLFGLATVVFAGIYFFRSYAAGDMSWGFPIRVGILVAAVQLIDNINTSVTLFHGYDTSQAMWTFLGMRGIDLLTGIAGAGFMAMVLIALGNTLLKAICPQEMGLDRWGGLLRFAEGSPWFWLHTLAMAGSFFLLKLGMQNLNLFVKYEWLADHLKPTGYNLSRLNTYLPSLDALGDGIMVFMGPLLVLVILLVWKRVVSRPWIIVAGLIIITLTTRAIQPAQGLGHFATLAGMELFYIGMQLAMVVLVIRFNLMAYFISAWASRLILGPGLGMLERTDIGFYQANSVVILVLGFAPLLFPLIAKWRQGGERSDLPAV